MDSVDSAIDVGAVLPFLAIVLQTRGDACALVDRAFRTDSKGQIKTAAVLELLRLDIDDPEWLQAMEAIKDSIEACGTAVYVRFYVRGEGAGQWNAIPLDLAAV